MNDSITFLYNDSNIPRILPAELAVLIGVAAAVILFWVFVFLMKFKKEQQDYEGSYLTKVGAVSAVTLVTLALLAVIPQPEVRAEDKRTALDAVLTSEGYQLTGSQLDKLINMPEKANGIIDFLSKDYGKVDLGSGRGLLMIQIMDNDPFSTTEYQIQHVNNQAEIDSIFRDSGYGR
jgi:hypothetical protein